MNLDKIAREYMLDTDYTNTDLTPDERDLVLKLLKIHKHEAEVLTDRYAAAISRFTREAAEKKED